MTESLQHIDTVTEHVKRQNLNLEWREYWWPLAFLVSMSLMGLKFPLGYLFVPLILISSFRRDRYDFLIMLTLFFGGYGLIGEGTLPVKPWDIGMVVSVIGAVILRKTPLMKKVLWLIVAYTAALLLLASCSEERMSIQIRTLHNYLFFIYFVIPLMVFAGHHFDIKVFFRRLMPFVIILFLFYVLDGYVFHGHIMLPVTFIWSGTASVFYSPVLYGLSYFPRVYPPGLFLAALAVYPLSRFYNFSWWQWALCLLAFTVTRTFTVITGLIAEYVIAMPNIKKLIGLGFGAAALLLVIYVVDSQLPPDNRNGESALRVYSSVQQIINLGHAQDDEDVSELGSGRLGQALPKFELVNELDRQATGLGFLHSELTTNTKYIIDNPFYNDNSRSIEVATGVEVEPIQVYLSIGYIGLLIHFAFIFMTYFLIRKLKYSFYYVTVLFALFWFGLGGFAMLIAPDGLLLASLAFSVVVLHWRSNEQEQEA